ncbi:hypothetical protein M8C21_016141 [Ambrosia artemisiifolia]|uniref:Uncharacterized protein n=1 Tax=Ambrosia artemisiifolia TaxID=4212 RepID=A0AAD5CMV3_AMBAR|nr:hypothetical protein M8C21_016141 [Ambrosia artemisiifolia]
MLLRKAYKHVSDLRAAALALTSLEAKPEQFAVLVRDISASSDGYSRLIMMRMMMHLIAPSMFISVLQTQSPTQASKHCRHSRRQCWPICFRPSDFSGVPTTWWAPTMVALSRYSLKEQSLISCNSKYLWLMSRQRSPRVEDDEEENVDDIEHEFTIDGEHNKNNHIAEANASCEDELWTRTGR